MTIGTNNLEEEMAAMKAILERLVKESEEKEARIKLQEEKISANQKAWETANLIPHKKLRKQGGRKGVYPKWNFQRGGLLKEGQYTQEWWASELADLWAYPRLNFKCGQNTLVEGARKTHLYTKPYTKISTIWREG